MKTFKEHIVEGFTSYKFNSFSSKREPTNLKGKKVTDKLIDTKVRELLRTLPKEPKFKRASEKELLQFAIMQALDDLGVHPFKGAAFRK